MKVFISSTYQDLIEYRAKTAEVVARLGQQDNRMEVFGARPDDATKVSLKEIDESDLVVGIYAHRYGYTPRRGGQSITEKEYDYAVKRKKPVLCFVVDENYPWRPSFIEGGVARKKLQVFKERMSASLVRETFTTPEDLAFKITASISRYISTIIVRDQLNRTAEELLVGPESSRNQVARRAARLSSIINGSRVLIVNDIPTKMSYVIEIFVSLGISVTVAVNTAEALSFLAKNEVDLVISDMRRGEVPDEGLRFLKKMRMRRLHRLTIFVMKNYKPELGTPSYAFGITNSIDDLLNLTFDALERVRG